VDVNELLSRCAFPTTTAPVAVAVSGGPDSVGLFLLARAAGLDVVLHHVDHHVRPTSGDDAQFVRDLGADYGVSVVVHDINVTPGPNFEQRARVARRAALPDGALTGHTMDDAVETFFMHLLRGSGRQGLTSLAQHPTKPLLQVRRSDLHAYVAASGIAARQDETNSDLRYTRNRIRTMLLPVMDDVMRRDVVPIIQRTAEQMYDEWEWIRSVTALDDERALGDIDCRELRDWPRPRLRLWLRQHLGHTTDDGDTYAPSAAEIERVIAVVAGDVVACEISGGRRLSRRDQRLSLAD